MSERDGVRVPPDPALVDVIEKALYGYVKPFQAVHVARKVVRVIAAGLEQVGWLCTERGASLSGLVGMDVDIDRVNAEPVYVHHLARALPEQPAPSIQEPEHG